MTTVPYAAVNTQVFIASSVTAEPADAAAYAALSWTEITGIESLGDFGDESPTLTATDLKMARVFKAKGARDAGTMTITCNDIADDSGQDALIVAEGTRFDYPFKIVLPNRLTTGGSDEVNYFIGKVMSKRRSVGDVNTIVKRTFSVAINSKITSVDPT